MKKLALIVLVGLIIQSLSAGQFHVSIKGSNNNDGSASKPFRTISAAAQVAQPGDVITVHEGTYRERVTPPRGGVSDSKRIVYQANKGEKVVIKGSEVVTGWKHVRDGVWKVIVANTFFGEYNPYKDIIAGDWFDRMGRDHHTGEVYLNGKSLFEKGSLDEVTDPKPHPRAADKQASLYTWYCQSDDKDTTIWANFHKNNPNKELVEINVRDACFYPDAPGRNYITVRGFHMSQAATQWAPPTAEQIGLIGTHWSKGWIIENNVISDSKCTGVTLGKDRKSGHNVCAKNPGKGGAQLYNEVVARALENGWSKETIGSHIVRNNTIFNCEQAGICGSLGAVFSQITDNHIHDIWTKWQFEGDEIAGIKIHASIDMLIKNNRIQNTGKGIWMDWMSQGTRITGNLCYSNILQDFYSEVNHGPYIVDNNIFLSKCSVWDMSQGGAYVHNLMAGKINLSPHSRKTPYHLPHSTAVVGLREISGGDNRFFNNVFVAGYEGNAAQRDPEYKKRSGYGNESYGLQAYNYAVFPVIAHRNVYLKGAKPCIKETNQIEKPDFDPNIEIFEQGENIYLSITLDKSFKSLNNELVTTKLLGKAMIPGQAFENPDGSPLKIDTDYFGKRRNKANPSAGPFENAEDGKHKLKVW
ncbi:MAG: right-handed parallel beta-helix repeat-containing protein [Planctomycetota bacterium]